MPATNSPTDSTAVVATFRAKLCECHKASKPPTSLVQWMFDNGSEHSSAIVQEWCSLFINQAEMYKPLLQLLNLVVLKAADESGNYDDRFAEVLEDTVKKAFQIGKLAERKEGVSRLKNCLLAWKASQKFGKLPHQLLQYLTSLDNLQQLREKFPSHSSSQLENALRSCNNNITLAIEKLQSPEASNEAPLRVDDPASERSIQSFLSDGQSSMASWADEVDAEIGDEAPPASPAVKAALARSPSNKLDQFASKSMAQKQLLKRATPQQVLKQAPGSPTRAKQASAQPATAPKQQQQRASPPVTPARMPTVGANGKPLTERDLIQLLWSKVTQLEATCKAQEEELVRLRKLELKVSKLDEFVLETRQEMGKIMQKQLNSDRGLGAGVADTPRRRNGAKHRGFGSSNSLQTPTSGSNSDAANSLSPHSLNPEAVPFVPSWSSNSLQDTSDTATRSSSVYSLTHSEEAMMDDDEPNTATQT